MKNIPVWSSLSELTRAVPFEFDVNRGKEICATVSPAGRYLFFARDGDHCQADAKIIDMMKSKVMRSTNGIS